MATVRNKEFHCGQRELRSPSRNVIYNNVIRIEAKSTTNGFVDCLIKKSRTSSNSPSVRRGPTITRTAAQAGSESTKNIVTGQQPEDIFAVSADNTPLTTSSTTRRTYSLAECSSKSQPVARAGTRCSDTRSILRRQRPR